MCSYLTHLMKHSHFIQWNCHGFKANLTEMQRLATIFCFCHLLPSEDPSIIKRPHILKKNFLQYIIHDSNTQRPLGGSAVLVGNYIIHSL